MRISPRVIIRMTAIDATAGDRRKKIAACDLHPTDGNRNGTQDQNVFPGHLRAVSFAAKVQPGSR